METQSEQTEWWMYNRADVEKQDETGDKIKVIPTVHLSSVQVQDLSGILFFTYFHKACGVHVFIHLFYSFSFSTYLNEAANFISSFPTTPVL